MVDIVCTGGGWCAPSAGGGSGWWHVMYPALRPASNTPPPAPATSCQWGPA